jgi:hypothetical protein
MATRERMAAAVARLQNHGLFPAVLELGDGGFVGYVGCTRAGSPNCKDFVGDCSSQADLCRKFISPDGSNPDCLGLGCSSQSCEGTFACTGNSCTIATCVTNECVGQVCDRNVRCPGNDGRPPTSCPTEEGCMMHNCIGMRCDGAHTCDTNSCDGKAPVGRGMESSGSPESIWLMLVNSF